MIIGKRPHFAVEFEVNKEYGGVWLFGKCCFWIKDQRIGDYELGTSLRDVLFQMRTIVLDNGKRIHNDLFALDTAELYRRLNGALYGCDGTACCDTNFETIAVEETWARFNVSLPVDIFDGWKIFLVESQEKARIIVKKIDKEGIYEAFLTPGEFDEVIAKAYGELDKLYEIELAKG
ncbi:immunity 42 family protein [Acetonema longum]|uniref:Uncharacterized protein n=1 Tax=Acetonema longum DSM 6540 TaxID=1009370 RepID=F7NGF2_9FIRM|nr:immunity 42 family protein [Acetonema longum]EGO64879.1 hypothetical protein ALO_05680 [Acetonema longum DSM 6540]